VSPVWRGSAKPATRSLLIWGGGLAANQRLGPLPMTVLMTLS